MTHIKTHEELLRELFEAIAADAKDLGVYPELHTWHEVFWGTKSTLDLYHDVVAALKKRKS